MNGGFIDTKEVSIIINKLKLYIENEKKIISNIKEWMNNIQSSYLGDNSPLIQKKAKNLFINLDTLLKNRESYIEYINQVIKLYMETDEKNYTSFKRY